MGTVDEALAQVAGFRVFSVASFIGLSISCFIPLASLGLSIVFIGFVSPHHCKVPEGSLLNETIPLDEYGQMEKCTMYHNGSTVACTEGWTYHPVYGEHTIVMEWDLVCEKNYLAELSQTIYQAGALVGELIAAVIVDRYGRKWLSIGCYVLVAAFGVGSAYTQSYTAFLVMRTIAAVFVAMLPIAGMTHIMELVSMKERVFFAMFCEYGWSICFFFTAFIAYFIRGWQMMLTVFSLCALLGLFTIVVPESPYWLAANHREEEAEEVVQKIAKYNRVPVQGRLLTLPGEALLTNGDVVKEDAPSSTNTVQFSSNMTMEGDEKYRPIGEEKAWDLFTDPLLRKSLLISMTQWFMSNFLYYFAVLGAYVFGGNLYLNFFLGGVIEVPAFCISYFICKRGRRIPTSIFYCVASVIIFALGFTPKQTESGVSLIPLIIILVLAMRFCAACSFCVIILYTKELFPTNLRGCGVAFGTVFGRVGNMITPFAVLAVSVYAWLPNVVIGSLSFIVGLLTLLLPETKHWPLPQSIADVHHFTEGTMAKDSCKSNQSLYRITELESAF